MKRKLTLWVSIGLALVMTGLFSAGLVEAKWARSNGDGIDLGRLCTDGTRIGIFTDNSNLAGTWEITVKKDTVEGDTLAMKFIELEARPPLPLKRDSGVVDIQLYNYITVLWDSVAAGTHLHVLVKHTEQNATIQGEGDVQQCDDDLDDFNRTGPKLGASWQGQKSPGHYRIKAGKVEVLAGGPIYWQPATFGDEQEAQVTLETIDPQGHHSLLLKVQADKQGRPDWKRGAVAVFYNAEHRHIGIETYRPKTGWQTVATFETTLQGGDQLAGRISGIGSPAGTFDGIVFAFVNDELIGAAVIDSFFVEKGGSIGLWFDSPSSSAVFDDFKGGESSVPSE